MLKLFLKYYFTLSCQNRTANTATNLIEFSVLHVHFKITGLLIHGKEQYAQNSEVFGCFIHLFPIDFEILK